MATGTEKSLYTLLADLLAYPAEDMVIKAEECVKMVEAEGEYYPPEVAIELRKFQKDVGAIPLGDLQGVYSYTFELTSEFTLDMGYHLYDGFRRANSLSTIKAMYNAHKFPYEEYAKGELPDNLVIVLKFLGFIKDPEIKKSFRESFVILAMEKLVKNFQKNKKNPYGHLISAVYRIIEKDVKEVKE